MRKRSSKNWPVKLAPTILRVSLLAPSQAITQSASRSKPPSGVRTVSRACSSFCCSAISWCFQPMRDLRVRHAGIDQRLLDVVLLQVDHRRHLVPRFGQQVEAVDQLVFEKHLAHLPAHALVHQRRGHAQAVPDLQRPLGVAHRARAEADGVVVVEQQHRQAALRAVERDAQADGPGADDHQRVALDAAFALRGALPVRELGVGVALGHRALTAPVRPRASSARAWARAWCCDHSSSIAHFTSSSFLYMSGVPVSQASSRRWPLGSKK